MNQHSPFKIESLLSARLFVSPQLAGDRLYFVSDLSGRLSLYAMDKEGSVPEPLLPRNIALQNPSLMRGESFYVFPRLGKILVMIDHDGDENYQPMFIPLEGGIPESPFGDRFQGMQVALLHADQERELGVFNVDPRSNPNYQSYLVNFATLELTDLGASIYGNEYLASSDDFSKIALVDSYTIGDNVVYLWEKGSQGRRLLYGKPLEERKPGESVSLNSISFGHITPNDGMLFVTCLFDDAYGLGYLKLDQPADIRRVEIVGLQHRGAGEIEQRHGLRHLRDDRCALEYNIDGVSFLYEGRFDEANLRLEMDALHCGAEGLANGVLQAYFYEKATGSYTLSFSTATSPSQLYTIENREVHQLTREKVLGIPQELLAVGEDVSYNSHDGLRISARLYLPSPELGFSGKRPVIFYIHGGPQSQERPDFTWFSMPLIQFFTLNGFAVYVPNVRGSLGYGLSYMKRVDHDWGGQDRLDHIAAFQVLERDARLDMTRVGVMGRSYGGYMTLTLAGRHPELWRAACDMFGPYNLFTFLERLPETWRTYFFLAVGHPERDREFLTERSPSTHLHRLACPLLVLQGRNDPRVVEAESQDLVNQLRDQGKEVELIVFEDEGHDVLKIENKVRCYNEIVRFFTRYLEP